MHPQTLDQPDSSTTVKDAIDNGLSGSIRALTQAVVGVWADRHPPKRPAIAKVHRAVRFGQVEPLKPLLTLAFGAIDEGKDPAVVVQPYRDFIALVDAYAARRDRRQSAGVLPFPEVRTRVAVRAEREDCEADCDRMQIKDGCIATLEKARASRQEAIAEFQREVEVMTNEIAFLRVNG